MIEKIWSGESPLWRLLLPLSWLYGLVSGAIRLCYKLKLKRAWRAPVPVVVVGNLTAGGNGKTPVVVWLVEQLQQRGIRVGVVSRGYGGKAESYPLLLSATTVYSITVWRVMWKLSLLMVCVALAMAGGCRRGQCVSERGA